MNLHLTISHTAYELLLNGNRRWFVEQLSYECSLHSNRITTTAKLWETKVMGTISLIKQDC